MKKTYADECLERAEKATPGPWKHCYIQVGHMATENGPQYNENDGEFISHARTDVPELARRLNSACEILRRNGMGWLADELEAMPEEK